MKKLLFFTLSMITAMLFISCGGAGLEPTDNITLGQAFDHVSKSFGYWVFIILAAAIGGYVAFRVIKQYEKTQDWTTGNSLAIFAILVVLSLTIFMRPCEVAANTTVEQAARGVFIGY